MQHDQKPARNRPTNILAVGLMIALLTVVWIRSDMLGPVSTQAAGFANAESQPKPRFSAGEQRREMINELKKLSQRVEALEAKLDRGIKISSMPPVVVKE